MINRFLILVVTGLLCISSVQDNRTQLSTIIENFSKNSVYTVNYTFYRKMNSGSYEFVDYLTYYKIKNASVAVTDDAFFFLSDSSYLEKHSIVNTVLVSYRINQDKIYDISHNVLAMLKYSYINAHSIKRLSNGQFKFYFTDQRVDSVLFGFNNGATQVESVYFWKTKGKDIIADQILAQKDSISRPISRSPKEILNCLNNYDTACINRLFVGDRIIGFR